MVAAMLLMFTSGTVCLAEDEDAPAEDQGILPVPDYSGDLWTRSHLTGDWGGVRQDWAEKGITVEVDWYQAYQGVVSGGFDEGSEYSTNLDYRVMLDLQRMGAVPGALVNIRGQSRFGNTVNDLSGLSLPVNMYAYFPFSPDDPDGDVNFAITELNWTQFLSENIGLLAGKITTLGTANEFMGGEGRTQFMNFQFNFSAVVAQVAPYSTLAASAFWMPSPSWTLTTTFMNLQDASTTSGFDDFGDGTTWATTADYLGSLNELPGGGSFGFYYGFDADFSEVGGLHFVPGIGISMETERNAWALTWNGWQYLLAEDGSETVDPSNGRQDLQGLGVFLNLGLADKDTNPVAWSAAGGLSGRGSIPTRDDDTWGLGYFYNGLQDLDLGPIELKNSTSGVEAYYDIALTGWANLALNAQWAQNAFRSVDDAWILAARLNVSF
jgi:porin